MPKRIRKKEGSTAWQKAMQKSMKRMARDFVNVQRRVIAPKTIQQQQEMMKRYTKNKSPAQSLFIVENLEAALTKAKSEKQKAIRQMPFEQMSILREQRTALDRRIRINLGKYLKKPVGRRDKKLLLRITTGLKLYIQKIEEQIAKMGAITNPYIRTIKKEKLKELNAEKEKIEERLKKIEKRTKEVN